MGQIHGTNNSHVPPAVFQPPSVGPVTSFTGAVTLPPDMSVEQLVGWLNTELGTSDATIRTTMMMVQNKKNQEFTIGQLLAALQEAKSRGQGNNNCRLSQDLIDGTYKNSAAYQSLPQSAKDVVDGIIKDAGTNHPWDPSKGNAQIRRTSSGDVTINGTPDELLHPPDGSPPLAYLAADGKSLIIGGDGCIDNDKLDAHIKALTEVQTSMNTDDEQSMIRLQSMVSARARLIEMVSNIVKSTTDTAKEIVGNVR